MSRVKVNQKARSDSTEALLDVIRGNGVADAVESQGGAEDDAGNGAASEASQKRPGRRLALPALSLGGRAVVGVDITSESINIAKFAGCAGRGRLLGLEQVELGKHQVPGTPEFESVLASLLAKHVSKPKKTDIWTLVRSSEIDATTLNLPKMPSRRLSSAVYWQLQKEKKFDAAESVLDYNVQGPVTEDGVSKLDVLAGLANRSDVESLDKMFTAIGYPLTGITLLPAAFRSLYQIGWVPNPGAVAANIHVDTNFTCITLMHEGRVVFSRTIRFGVVSVAEEFCEQYNSSSSGDDLAMPGDEVLDASPEMTLDHAIHVVIARINGEEPDPDVPGSELETDEILELVSTSLDRVSRQSERTLDYVSQNLKISCDVLHLSGEVFNSKRMCDYIISALGMDGTPFRPLKEAGRRREVERFIDPSTCMRFTEAVALAAAPSASILNLKHTYVERDREAAKTMVTNILCLVALFFVMIGAGAFAWGEMMVAEKKAELAVYERELSAHPIVDEGKLQIIASKAALRNTNVRDVCDRYRPLAVLSEVSDLMPEGVRLLSMEVVLGEKPEEEAGKPAPSEEETALHSIVLDGIVLAGERDPETLLARLLANLESSDLIQDVDVVSSQVESFIPEGDVMHFVIEAKLS